MCDKEYNEAVPQFFSDFEASLTGATEIPALVSAWQSGAISRDTLLHNFRTGEILPPARPNDEEIELIRKEPPPPNVTSMPQPAGHDDQSGK
jgi:hypothetical protein